MRYLIAWIFINLAIISKGQDSWKFRHITTNEGLSTGTVNCTFQDSRGFVWFGTINGLNRFDGHEIREFINDKDNLNSISGNSISDIEEDSQGRLWIATRENGISIYDYERNTFKRIHPSNSELPDASIRVILKANDDKMLIGLNEGGLVIYDINQESMKIYAKSDGPASLNSNKIFDIVKAKDGRFLVSTDSKFLNIFDLKSERFDQFSYGASSALHDSNRKRVLEDSNGNIWVATDGDGLYKTAANSNETEHFVYDEGQLNSPIVTCLYEDKEGLIYIGTDGAGINILNPNTGQFRYLTNSIIDPESLTSDAIYDIYEDNSGIIWISTFRGGINYYSPKRNRFKLYEEIPFEPNSLSFNSVIDVLETEDGMIWIGTDGGGLDMLDPNTGDFQHFRHDPNDSRTMSTNVAISMEEDKNGYLWVGTYSGGVNRLDRRTGTFKRFLPGSGDGAIIDRNVWEILEDSNGDLWFGLLNGALDKYNPETETFTHYLPSDDPNTLSGGIIAMLEDSEGNFWIATETKGLNLFDRKTGHVQRFQSSEDDSTSILSNNVRTLFEDSKGNLWVGTGNGINMLNKKTYEFTVAPANQILPNLIVNGILEDASGFFWIATSRGLSRYDAKKHEIQNFTKADGLQGNEFNYTSSVKSKDGTMYFGGVNGLNAFHPSQIQLNSHQPNLVFTSIKVLDQPIESITNKKGERWINQSIQELDELSLNYSQNVLEFNFASLDYNASETNRYRFQLINFDEKWVYRSSSDRSAKYTNLDPGDYVFQVQGTNSDGIWSDKVKVLSITIKPPWWGTWWFRLIVFASIVSSLYLFYYWRTRSAKLQRLKLQREVEEATRTVRARNDALRTEQQNLTQAIEETNFVISEAVESGNFSSRIQLEDKTGEWYDLARSINTLFDSIVRPFSLINEIIEGMAQNDLTLRYEEEEHGDIRKVTENLNLSLDKLTALLREVATQTQSVGETSENMLTSAQDMKVATGEIATSTSELSAGAQEQVMRIDQASQILEELLKVSTTMSHQTEVINKNAEGGSILSGDGKAQMSLMERNLQKMQETSNQTNDSIQVLSKKSNNIARMLVAIKEIAAETNLLALNASIEAAKAGDYGRGFAVVAGQIRNLAENSGKTVQEIEQTINEVSSSLSETVLLSQSMGKVITDNVTTANQTTEAFDKIAASNEKTLELSSGILSSTQDQHEKIAEVVQLMESVVVISEQAAAGTEEIASSANELSAGMTEYVSKSTQSTEVVQQLKEQMNQFHLKNDESD